jgi:hypothetical protein
MMAAAPVSKPTARQGHGGAAGWGAHLVGRGGEGGHGRVRHGQPVRRDGAEDDAAQDAGRVIVVLQIAQSLISKEDIYFNILSELNVSVCVL